MIASAVCASLGQLLWRLFGLYGHVASLFLGFACYIAGGMLMIAAYRFGDASKLHPIQSVSYVLAIILGGTVLHEKVSFGQILGVGLILVGVYVINWRPRGKKGGKRL
jgi:drug/metabolite transporter (DMT)-like permease